MAGKELNGNGRNTIIKVLGASLISLILGGAGGHFALPARGAGAGELRERVARNEACIEALRGELDSIKGGIGENRSRLDRILERLPPR